MALSELPATRALAPGVVVVGSETRRRPGVDLPGSELARKQTDALPNLRHISNVARHRAAGHARGTAAWSHAYGGVRSRYDAADVAATFAIACGARGQSADADHRDDGEDNDRGDLPQHSFIIGRDEAGLYCRVPAAGHRRPLISLEPNVHAEIEPSHADRRFETNRGRSGFSSIADRNRHWP
jgi:hypothetical protein